MPILHILVSTTTIQLLMYAGRFLLSSSSSSARCCAYFLWHTSQRAGWGGGAWVMARGGEERQERIDLANTVIAKCRSERRVRRDSKARAVKEWT